MTSQPAGFWRVHPEGTASRGSRIYGTALVVALLAYALGVDPQVLNKLEHVQ